MEEGMRWRKGEVEEGRGGGESLGRGAEGLTSHLRIQVIQGELLCGESQVALLRKTQCKLAVSVKLRRRSFLTLYIHMVRGFQSVTRNHCLMSNLVL